MKRVLILLPLLAVVIAGSIFLFTLNQSSAVQAPRISIDMDPTGNTYIPSVDADFDGIPESGNIMTVGTIENCLTSIPGNNAEHSHPVHVVIQDVEDLIGWQARINFDGTMVGPPTNIDYDPFADPALGGNVSFVNLPVGTAPIPGRKTLFGTQEILDPTTVNGTALMGSASLGDARFDTSPDVPQKVPHDEASQTYTVTGGGVLAAFDFVTRAGQDGQQTLLLDVDDNDPNNPGSKADFFTGTGLQTIEVAASSLGDGHHGEGVECVALAQETPPPATDTPAPTPTLAPGQTAAPTPPPGAATPTPRPGAGAVTPTRAPAPAALPPTGGTGDGLWPGYTLVLAAALAASASGAAFGMWRLRRR
jgi:hypothetical protein